ncbi:MAG: ABC transporter substrate-binding protein, partial [Gemmatimonadaceae bacterium]|nr:ABC transporter substrate-binding protein [Gemmatimonadaceae bacterium]
MLLLGVLVGACGRAAADRTGNARTARVGMVDPVLSLDPRAARFVSEADVATQGFDGLVETTPSGEVIGTLAHRWEWLDEGRRLRVHLKQGTRWHDGRTLRADEVVASLRAALDDSTVATANDELVEMLAGKARDGEVPGGRRALLERIQAVDDSTLDLRIQPGDSTRIAAFGGTGWLVQRPGPAGSGPIGTGR